MICPKCGSRHIIDNMCVMCGALVLSVVEAPERPCMACGRKQQFVGTVCVECEEAISLGAKTLKRAAEANVRSDKRPVFAVCPAIAPLQDALDKAIEWKRYRREISAAYRKRRKEQGKKEGRSEESKARKKETNKAWIKAHPDKLKQYHKKYRESEKGRDCERRHEEKRKRERAEYVREYNRERRRILREKIAAMTPEELAEYKASPAYQERLRKHREAARAAYATPEGRARKLAINKKYRGSPKGKVKASIAGLRWRAKQRLIRENEEADRRREKEDGGLGT